MAYSKRIKGDSNQANEEFSHNRIYVEAGISGVILVLFCIILVSVAIIWMMLRNGSLLSILIVLSFLAVFIGAGIVGACFVVVRISDMIKEVRVNRILSSTVVAGEVVSHYDGGEWTHLSSIHEQGKVIPALPMKELPSGDPRWDAVLDLRRQGKGMHAIAKELKVPYQRVREFLNQVEGNLEGN
jgi:hypothetical protein